MTIMHLTSAAACLTIALCGGQAMAASSKWAEAGGGQLRIITEEAPRDGVLHGAIEIRLQPGWKTYWRDPGEAGVPPQIGIAGSDGIGAAEILYPAPEWVDDGYSVYAAYKHSVMLPLRLMATGDGASWRLKAQVFAGICEKICIPVQADLEVASGQGEIADDLVAAAFAALPSPAKPGLEVSTVEDRDGALTARAELPEGLSEASLFLAGGDGWYFGQPKWDGASSFAITVYDRPDASGGVAPSWDYTLVADGQAVSGTVALGK